jgi:4-amino-4-deoxy-L-arabinose transferase-like glycosyltransferase
MPKKTSFLASPYFLFGLFLLGNFCLTYLNLSMTLKLWIGFGAILLPLGWSLIWGKAAGGSRPTPFDGASKVAPWMVLLILSVVALVFRFYHLTTLSTWPRVDEGISSYSALEISQQWRWKFFHTYSQLPPLHYWLLAIFFKIFEPSLLSNWLFPAILSLATAGLSYLAARQFFNLTSSLAISLLFCGGFWPAYIARFAQPDVVMLLAEVLCFLILGFWLKRSGRGIHWGWLVLLGIGVGLGFYTYAAWPAFAAVVLVLVAHKTFQVKSKRALVFFALMVFLVTLPLWIAALREGFGSYLHRVWMGSTLNLGGQFYISLSYLVGLLWGTDQGDYGPIYGGLLNPLFGSLALMGLAEGFRRWREKFWGWVLGGTVLLLLPGLLTNNVEFNRIVLVYPFLALWAITGLFRLVEAAPVKWRLILLALLLVFSTLLDARHLFQAYPQRWAHPGAAWGVNIKSVEYWGAHQVLKRESTTRGPGAVLEELQPDPFDRTLTIANYPFDTARNPAFRFEDSKWVAVIANVHYTPFLRKRFPDSEIFQLPVPEKAQYGGDILQVIEITPGNHSDLKRWFEVNRAFQKVTSVMMERKEHQDRTRIFEMLYPLEVMVKGDPFLESCFWEKAHVQHNLEAAYGDRPFSEIYPKSLYTIQQATRLGYPSAHFYNEMGVLLEMGKRMEEARAAFLKATKAPLNRTSAADHLIEVERKLREKK